MKPGIEFEVVTPKGLVIKTEIKGITIPAMNGQAGILLNHLPYMTLLSFGEISYTDLNNNIRYLYLEEGFLEVMGNKIQLISDAIVKDDELIEEELMEEAAKIKERLDLIKKGDISADDLDSLLLASRKINIKLHMVKKRSI